MSKDTNYPGGGGKGGYSGTRMWGAPRLEGVVKNKAIKPVRKTKKK